MCAEGSAPLRRPDSEDSERAGAPRSPASHAPIVANPLAGDRHAKGAALEIQAALREIGLDAPIHWTEGPDHTESLARDLMKDAECIVACGGDGTVHQVANPLAGTDVGLAVVPAGRGNDLARVLGIPSDPAAFAKMVSARRRRRIDLGRATDGAGRSRYFCTVAALGFDAEVAKRLVSGGAFGGPRAYVYGVLKTLLSYRPQSVRLEGDFGVIDGEVFLVATGNTSTYGGGFKIAPGAEPDDGLLRVCLIRPVSRLVVLALLRLVRPGKHLNHPAVSLYETRSVKISAPEPLDLYADGEPLFTTPVTLEVVGKALDVIVP